MASSAELHSLRAGVVCALILFADLDGDGHRDGRHQP